MREAKGRGQSSRAPAGAGHGWLWAAVAAGVAWAVLYIAAMLRIPYDGKECLVGDALMMLGYWIGVAAAVAPLALLALGAEWGRLRGGRGKAAAVAGTVLFLVACAWVPPRLEMRARVKMREERRVVRVAENGRAGARPSRRGGERF